MRPFALWLLALLALLWPGAARAEGCPEGCCVTQPAAATAPLPTRVRLGMRIRHIGTIDEQRGIFRAELTLLSRWPAGGLRPDPHPRNAGEAFSVVLDETTRSGDQCYREQRLNGEFRTWFRLRRFPFDTQKLRLNLEDRAHDESEVVYESALWPTTISVEAYREIAGWRIADYPSLTTKHSSFAYPKGARAPQLLIAEIPVSRHYLFFVTRFFLPLFLIVVLAYCLFWIRAEDLSSASSIGITCVLSIITFQITQADRLPRIPYLTIADVVYVVCYAATGFAVIATVREAYLAAEGRHDEAVRLDLRLRRLFPLLVLSALAVACAFTWNADVDPSRDVPHELPPARAPEGEG